MELVPYEFLGNSANTLYSMFELNRLIPMLGEYDRTAETWEDLVASTSLAIFPPAERLTVCGDLPFGIARAKVRVMNQSLLLNFVMTIGGDRSTANFVCPVYPIRLADLHKYYQEKSSTMHCGQSEFVSTVMRNKKAMSLIMDKSEASTVSRYLMQFKDFDDVEFSCSLASVFLLRLQLTLTLHKYIELQGRSVLTREDGAKYISMADLLWLGSKLPSDALDKKVSIPSDLHGQIEAGRGLLDCTIGETSNLFSYFASCNPATVKAELEAQEASRFSVEDVNTASKEGLLLLDGKGVPLPTSAGKDLRCAKWAIRPMGLRNLYALFLRSREVWAGAWIRPLPELFSYVASQTEGYVETREIRQLCSKEEPMKGFTLAAWLGKTTGIVEFEYTCAQEMLEEMSPFSTLQSTADISYFLRVLMWRARAVGIRDGTPINTGLLDCEEKFMHVAFRNLYGNINFVAVEYLGGGEETAPLLLYDNPHRLLYRPKGSLKYHDNSLCHVLLENKERFGDELSGVSELTLLNGLRYSVQLAEKQLKINPMYAQPFYDHNRNAIAYFIPFYLERGGDVRAALLVSGDIVRTVYTLEWARQRAVCMGTQVVDWLR